VSTKELLPNLESRRIAAERMPPGIAKLLAGGLEPRVFRPLQFSPGGESFTGEEVACLHSREAGRSTLLKPGLLALKTLACFADGLGTQSRAGNHPESA